MNVYVYIKVLLFGFFFIEVFVNDLRFLFVKFKIYNKEEYNLKRSLI